MSQESWMADLDAIEPVESDEALEMGGGAEAEITPPPPLPHQHVQASEFDQYLYEQSKTETPLGKVVSKGLQSGWAQTEELAADLRNAFAKHSPVMQEVDGDYSKNAQALDTAMTLPEFEQMRALTVADEFASALAAAQFTTTLVEELVKQQEEDEKNPPPPPPSPDGDEESAGPGGDEKTSGEGDDEDEDGPSPQEQAEAEAKERAEKQAMALRVATRKAAKAATDAVAEAQAAADAFGGGDQDARGYGPGYLNERYVGNMTDRAKIARLVAANPRLQKIAEQCGRMRTVASNAQSTRADHIPDEIADIEKGNNFARLLPLELLNLADPEMEDLFWMRLLDRGLMQYRLEGVEESKRGPIVCVVDESGSMEGEPADWAAGVALTLRQIAAKQQRDFCWIHGTGPDISLVEHYEKGKGTTERLVNSALHFFGGGSTFDTRLDVALEVIGESRYQKADIICITDSNCEIDPTFLQHWLEVKRERQFSCFGLFIPIAKRLDTMKVFCDAWAYVSPGDKDTDALTMAFSV